MDQSNSEVKSNAIRSYSRFSIENLCPSDSALLQRMRFIHIQKIDEILHAL